MGELSLAGCHFPVISNADSNHAVERITSLLSQYGKKTVSGLLRG